MVQTGQVTKETKAWLDPREVKAGLRSGHLGRGRELRGWCNSQCPKMTFYGLRGAAYLDAC